MLTLIAIGVGFFFSGLTATATLWSIRDEQPGWAVTFVILSMVNMAAGIGNLFFLVKGVT